MSEMSPGPAEKPLDVSHLRAVLADLANDELLKALDSTLLELEKRLLHYSHVGPELLEMANEGLVLAVRASARVQQAQSAAAHAAGHLKVVGIGDWAPRSTSPSWRDDPRVTAEDE